MQWSKTALPSIPLLLLLVLALLRSDLVLYFGWLIRGWTLAALVAFAVLLLPLFRAQGTWAFYLAMATHGLIYLVCLVGTWVAGATSDVQVSGIFPFSDAAGYFQDAIFLVAGKDLVYTNRPLFTAMLATGLGWTDLNLKLVLIFFSATASIASFLFAKEVAKLFGPLVAFVALVLTFLFYRRFLGSLLTENLGLTLGLLGTALLMQSLRAEKCQVILASYGLFILTMALFARAGALLVLPAILFYFLYGQRPNSVMWERWCSVAADATAIAIAIGCNSLLRQWTGSAQNVLFGNAAFSLYGMAAGYKGWSQIFADHPEFYGLPEPVFIHKILEATLNLIQHEPLQLLKAVVFSFGDFFVRLFGFAKLNFLFQDSREHLMLNLVLVILLNVCLFAGLGRLWKWRGKVREARFLLLAFIGILLSAPFAPPVDADSMRAYAATFPFIAVITGIGMAALSGLRLRSETTPTPAVHSTVVFVSAGVILIAVLGPWSVRGGMSHAYPQVQKPCPATEKRYVFQTHPVLAVHLVEGSRQTAKDYYPSTSLGIESFRTNLHFNPHLSNREELKSISPGSTIFLARDLADDKTIVFLTATSEIANRKGILSGCSDSLHPPRGFTPVKIHFLQALSID
jgi:hypothetical protein